MQAVFDRCRELSYFKVFDDASLSALIERARWYSLTGGMELFHQGDDADADEVGPAPVELPHSGA